MWFPIQYQLIFDYLKLLFLRRYCRRIELIIEGRKWMKEDRARWMSSLPGQANMIWALFLRAAYDLTLIHLQILHEH